LRFGAGELFGNRKRVFDLCIENKSRLLAGVDAGKLNAIVRDAYGSYDIEEQLVPDVEMPSSPIFADLCETAEKFDLDKQPVEGRETEEAMFDRLIAAAERDEAGNIVRYPEEIHDAVLFIKERLPTAFWRSRKRPAVFDEKGQVKSALLGIWKYFKKGEMPRASKGTLEAPRLTRLFFKLLDAEVHAVFVIDPAKMNSRRHVKLVSAATKYHIDGMNATGVKIVSFSRQARPWEGRQISGLKIVNMKANYVTLTRVPQSFDLFESART